MIKIDTGRGQTHHTSSGEHERMHSEHVRDGGVQAGDGELTVSQQLRRVQSIRGRLFVQVRGREEARLSRLQPQRDHATQPRVQANGQVEQAHSAFVRAHRVSNEVAGAHRHQNGRLRLENALHALD